MHNEYFRVLAILVIAGIFPLAAHLARGGKLKDWARPFTMAFYLVGFLLAAGSLAYLLSGSVLLAGAVVMALLWTGIAVAGHRLVFGEPDWRKQLKRHRAKRRAGRLPLEGEKPGERK